MKVIIVGTGKAAFLHSLKYQKIKIEFFFLDVLKRSKYIPLNKIYLSIDELSKKESISINDTIIDLCTPCSTFVSLINDFIKRGFNKFIVEKPFIVSNSYFDNKKELSFIMMENYKESILVKDMLLYIKENNLKIKSVYINFSKDRIKDSFSKRGMCRGQAPTNFEIEMPHEIYLANYILGNNNKIYKRILLKDMISGNNIIKNHGYGIIEYVQNDVKVVLESNLMNSENIRKIDIECNNNVTISIDFIIYNSKFDKLKNGSLIINNNGIIEKKEYNQDDNIYNSLKKYVNDLEKLNTDYYKKEILDFSRNIKYVIENATNE